MKQQGITFAYVKATQGIKFKDEKFGMFWKSLGELAPARKVYRGAYHFLAAGVDPTVQADRFVDYVNLYGGMVADDMVPCVDLEWDISKTNPDAWQGTDPAEIINGTLAFLEKVEARTGRRPIVYTARSWWHSVTAHDPSTRANFQRLAGYDIWIADYSKSNRAAETPFVPLDRAWLLWQFTATSGLGTGYPTDGFLDASVYKGSLDQFRQDFGIGGGH